jgi:hypothetical protein
VVVHFPEVNVTLELALDFRKSDGPLIAVVLVIAASPWPGLSVFLVVIIVAASSGRLRRD